MEKLLIKNGSFRTGKVSYQTSQEPKVLHNGGSDNFKQTNYDNYHALF